MLFWVLAGTFKAFGKWMLWIFGHVLVQWERKFCQGPQMSMHTARINYGIVTCDRLIQKVFRRMYFDFDLHFVRESFRKQSNIKTFFWQHETPLKIILPSATFWRPRRSKWWGTIVMNLCPASHLLLTVQPPVQRLLSHQHLSVLRLEMKSVFSACRTSSRKSWRVSWNSSELLKNLTILRLH